MSSETENKQPLIPSVLYTEGSENVKQDIENDLKVPDPEPEEADAAIAESVLPQVSKNTCGCGCKCRR